MAIELILRFWRELLIVLLLGFLMLQTTRLDSAQQELESHKTVAKMATQQAEKTLERLQTAIPGMVEQAQSSAVANYKKRFPAAVCRPVSDGLLPGGDGQAADPGRAGEAGRELLVTDPEFIRACARDAGRLNLWIEACKTNPLICEIKE